MPGRHFDKHFICNYVLLLRVAKNMWNNLFEPDGSYNQMFERDPDLICPDNNKFRYFNIK